MIKLVRYLHLVVWYAAQRLPSTLAQFLLLSLLAGTSAGLIWAVQQDTIALGFVQDWSSAIETDRVYAQIGWLYDTSARLIDVPASTFAGQDQNAVLWIMATGNTEVIGTIEVLLVNEHRVLSLGWLSQVTQTLPTIPNTAYLIAGFTILILHQISIAAMGAAVCAIVLALITWSGISYGDFVHAMTIGSMGTAMTATFIASIAGALTFRVLSLVPLAPVSRIVTAALSVVLAQFAAPLNPAFEQATWLLPLATLVWPPLAAVLAATLLLAAGISPQPVTALILFGGAVLGLILIRAALTAPAGMMRDGHGTNPLRRRMWSILEPRPDVNDTGTFHWIDLLKGAQK